MQALVIANVGDDDAGYVGERLAQRGYHLVQGYRDGEMPPSVEGFDLVLLLGSEWSTYWESVRADVERESALVQDAQLHEVPVLGICYGAQLVAQTFGGLVQPAPHTEFGWYQLDTDNDELASAGPWFQYHSDTWTAPEGAVVLARTSAGPQAFRLGRILAWQFHPEVSPSIVRRWGADSKELADREGVDLEELYAETDRQCRDAQARCHRLVDGFLDRVVTAR